MSTVTITDKTFKDAIESNDIVLVDFWAEWCGPCKKMNPILEEIASETNLTIAKLNIDANPNKADEYGVISIPTMILFKNGEKVATLVGAKPKHMLMKELSEWI